MARNTMPRKIKYSKIAIVMFLTVLIWVYADLALDDTLLIPNVPISIARSGDTELWASFKDESGMPVSSANVVQIVLKGPTSRIAEAKRALENNLLKLAFTLNPERRKMTAAGSYTLDVLDFVREREEIRGLNGLNVEACEPNTVTVDVVKLTRKLLDIQPVDESGRTLQSESITPSKINMFVPEDWGQNKVAEVMLTPGEISQARTKAIRLKPYVVLADGQKRQSENSVQVRLLQEEDELDQYVISRVRVGYTFSANTQGKFRVQVSNEVELTSSEIKIRATQEAKDAYEKQPFQATVEIQDNDDSADARRALKYNLPEEYVRKDEIKLDPEHEPVEARFKLIPLPSAENP